MKIFSLSIAIATTLFALTSCATSQMLSQSVSAPSNQTNYQSSQPHPHEQGHHAHWGYIEGTIMPEQWGDSEVNKLCKIGETQSPINIDHAKKSQAIRFDLNANYRPQEFSVVNNGHTVVFNAKNPTQSSLSINGKTYELLQFHYHVPSEHTVMNASYPLELHFVHKDANGNLAVVGVLVDKGEYNDELAKILTDLPTHGQSQGVLANFDVSGLMPKDSPAYAYEGSLTTPPCHEQVQWLLKAKPIHASVEQLKILSALYDGNNRPLQPQGNRTVYLVD